jgi:ABC-type phosphate/phosphonate transport system substrate-binding protein
MGQVTRHSRALGLVAIPLLALAAATLSAGAAPAGGRNLVLLIQPVFSEAQTRVMYQPLADFIGQAAGRPCTLLLPPNFMAYWDTVRRNRGFDLALDDAHFTDYRVRKFGFEVLAKEPDTVSQSLIVSAATHVIDPGELAGKTVASLGPPSLGAARFNVLFPNPMRQPFIVEADTVEEALRLVLDGKVTAAILPTPVVSRQLERGGGITVVTTTEPVPNAALSAAPTLDARLRARIRDALLDAAGTPAGRNALVALGIAGFEAASAETYANQSRVLRDYWGY